MLLVELRHVNSMSQNRIDPAVGNGVEYVCMILFFPKSIRNCNAIYKII
jgi:hypothetical protein